MSHTTAPPNSIKVPPPRPSVRSRQRLLPFGVRFTRRAIKLLGSKTVYLNLLAVLVGLGGGLGAVVFRSLITLVAGVVYPHGATVVQLAAIPWYALVLPPAAIGLVVGPLTYYLAREAKGHGVPEVMDAVANQGGRIRARVAGVKIIASALSIGAGISVGREGPIVQIGGSLGSTLGQWLHLDARTVRLLVGCGAAAGIAATFNAPMAGAIFALEVILGFGTIRKFAPLVVASVVATVVSRRFLGDYPAFEVPRYQLVSAWELGLYVLLGLLSAGVGVGFSRGLYWVEDLWDRIRIHEAIKPLFGGLMVGALALVLPHVMGAGYETIGAVLANRAGPGILLLLALMVGKIVATHLSLGSGFSGGVFAPALFIGAMLGAAFGWTVNALLPSSVVGPVGAYALVAMGAVVAASTHAPLTVILIVFEMTGDYKMILPLMLATLVASTLSVRLSRESIYTLKLARRGTQLGGSEDEVMRSTQVEMMLRPVPHTIRSDASFSSVLSHALQRGAKPLYVTAEEGTLLGTIFLEDVAASIRDQEILEQLLIADDMMRPVVETVSCDDTLARCLKILSHEDLPEVPVTDKSSRLLGVVTRVDILELYDHEVLEREGGLLSVMHRDDDGHAARSTVHLPRGERADRLEVAAGIAGKTLRELDLRARHGIHVHAIKSDHNGVAQRPDPDTLLQPGMLLLLTGPATAIRELAHLNAAATH